MIDSEEAAVASVGCFAQIPAFLGGLVALFWWFVLLWAWLGLGIAIAGTVFLSFIPLGIMYLLLMLVFGPLMALAMTTLGRRAAGRFFVVATSLVISLVIAAILVGSVVLVFVPE